MTKPIPPTITTPSKLILIRRAVSSQFGFWATWKSRFVDCRKLRAPNMESPVMFWKPASSPPYLTIRRTVSILSTSNPQLSRLAPVGPYRKPSH